MAKKRRYQKQQPYVLYGEGETEGVFLDHIKALYRAETIGKRILVKAANGGSPSIMVMELEKQLVALGAFAKVLLLIDEDIPLTEELQNKIKKIKVNGKEAVTLVLSKPKCLEGVLLSILDDLKKPHKNKSEALKKYFHKEYLKMDHKSDVVNKLKKRCPQLFTKEQLNTMRSSVPALNEILTFLGV